MRPGRSASAFRVSGRIILGFCCILMPPPAPCIGSAPPLGPSVSRPPSLCLSPSSHLQGLRQPPLHPSPSQGLSPLSLCAHLKEGFSWAMFWSHAHAKGSFCCEELGDVVSSTPGTRMSSDEGDREPQQMSSGNLRK